MGSGNVSFAGSFVLWSAWQFPEHLKGAVITPPLMEGWKVAPRAQTGDPQTRLGLVVIWDVPEKMGFLDSTPRDHSLAGLGWSFQIYVLPNLLQVTQLGLGGWALSAKLAGPQIALWVGAASWGKTWQEWNNSQRPKRLLSCCLRRFSSTKDLFHMDWKRAWHEEHLTFPAWIILRITWEVLLILLLVLFWNGYDCFDTVSGPAP